MAGRRLKSFRKGDWNEELGILLLKTIAAVAPIPRQEDEVFLGEPLLSYNIEQASDGVFTDRA